MKSSRKILLLCLFIVFTMLGCEPLPTPTSTTTSTTSTTVQTTTSVPSGNFAIRPSGSDDTAAFTAAAKDHPKVTVEGKLLINSIASFTGLSNREITFSSGSALVRTVRPENVTYQVLAFTNSSHIVINNLQIQGPNIEVCDWNQLIPANGPLNPAHYVHIDVGYSPKYESQHGIAFYGSDNITVNGGYIYGMSGDGIYFQDAPNGVTNDHITINNVSTECTGRNSISNTGSSNVTINGGTFKQSGYWIMNIEPFITHSVKNYLIDQPTIGFSNFAWLFSSGPDFSCKVTNVVINKPTFSGASTKPIVINPCVAGQITVEN